MTGLRSFNDSAGKRVLQSASAGYEIIESVVKRITVIEFGVNDWGSNRQLTNQGKAGYSEVDECDSNRLWREM